ncbi:MAG: alkylresorcinol/alkylpyrone synthase [Planctomycetota bacterium]|jgi:alkylresorcinol/alkylpyrone synthase
MSQSSLLGLATAEAPFPISQSEVRDATIGLFRGANMDLNALSSVFDNAGVGRRTFAWPLGSYMESPSVTQRAARFRELAPELLAEASANAAPPELRERITHIVTVTSSGIATPSLECSMAADIGLPSSARRVPLFGLGCGGGAAGLAIASDLANSSPNACVLLQVVELTSLTLMSTDATPRNFVACALFGDGAAAAVIGSPSTEFPALASIEKSTTHLMPDSLDLMGWEVVEAGWRLILSPRIPAIVKREVRGLMEAAMDGERPDHWILHPGGGKVLDAYAAALELDQGELADSAAVLREHGNMSAATVLFVLERVLRAPRRTASSGLLTAFGPGFSAEALRIALPAN